MTNRYKPSATSLALIAVALAANIVVISGLVTGVVPDILRLGLNLAVIVVVGLEWRKHRQGG